MAFTKRIEFANYTLKFGDDKIMLDLLEEIVWPSFQEREYIRKLKNRSSYFFLDTQLVNLRATTGEKSVAIAGRIVKNTKIARDQYYRSGGLVPDKRELASAPSAIFVLLLENHRLLYCREMSNAPGIQNFASTTQNFLSQRHSEFIQEKLTEVQAERGEIPRGVRTDLFRRFPRPKVRVTPLSGQQELKEFVQRFASIEQLNIKLLPTNHEEINNDDFWKEMERRRKEMKSENTAIRFSNADEGLSAANVVAQTAAATELANSEVTMRGHDAQGDKITGNNDDFSLTVPLEDLPTDVAAAAASMFGHFINIAGRGLITLPAIAAGVAEKVNGFLAGRE